MRNFATLKQVLGFSDIFAVILYVKGFYNTRHIALIYLLVLVFNCMNLQVFINCFSETIGINPLRCRGLTITTPAIILRQAQDRVAGANRWYKDSFM